MAAPTMPPRSWAAIKVGTFFQENPRHTASASVTAGFRWPPDIPLETKTPTATPTAQPKLIDKYSCHTVGRTYRFHFKKDGGTGALTPFGVVTLGSEERTT